jgi:hypothetical protein
VLPKAVIQAIPTYTMSIFRLPKVLCTRINFMMSRFRWGHNDNVSKVAWMSWEKMGRSEQKGGLGYRDLECFNMALLAKQGWRFSHNPNSLVARIMKVEVFSHWYFLGFIFGV